MPVSTVSRKVASLENQLGVTLMQRTTRKLSLTAQGRAYYNQCSEPLSNLFDAESALTQTQKTPEGLLKISVPVIMGQKPFYEFISALLKKYPRVHVDLFITNLFVDLVADNIDVAIRFGELRDSTIIAKRIGRSVRYLVASPDYLKGRTAPAKPEDLTNHQCVLLNGRNNEAEWHLVNDRNATKIPALLTNASMEPKFLIAVSATFFAVAGSPISPSTRASRLDAFISSDWLTWRDVATML